MKRRHVLITGGNRGLGRAIAQDFLQHQPEDIVWLGLHQRRTEAEALADSFPDRCRCLTLDVGQPECWREAVATVLKEGDRLDILVNNAGIYQDGLLAQLTAEAWESVRTVNLDAVFHGCQAVLPAMISQRHGRIINISSLSALLAPPGQTNYAAAKAGVIGLTQSLAKEVARLGITVNAICPGYVETEALAHWTTDQRQAALGRVPMRRFGQPEEIAAAVRFLACPQAAYITGSVLKIDGGIL